MIKFGGNLKMMRWETHVHTSEGSACATSNASDMAIACKNAGYDGMFITDHFYHGNTAVNRNLCWDEWVNEFCKGYYNAKKTGDNIGLRVCFGWEYTWEGNDFLTYGLSPEWLIVHSEVIRVEPYEYLKLIRDAGGCIVHAHPFREADYIKKICLLPDMVDGVEVYNGGNSIELFNDRALFYAKSFGLIQTSGSDAHNIESFKGGIITDSDICCTEDYVDVVKCGGIKGLIQNGKDYIF